MDLGQIGLESDIFGSPGGLQEPKVLLDDMLKARVGSFWCAWDVFVCVSGSIRGPENQEDSRGEEKFRKQLSEV